MSDSNIAAVMASLDAFLDSFNFTRKGVEGSLGKDVAMAVIRGPEQGQMGGIMGRIAAEVQPDGSPMRQNSPEYAARKDREYGWSEVNRRVGQMTSQQSLAADIRVSPDLVELHYGTGEAPDKSVSPNGHISKADRRVTDKEKATFAHQQGRAFFGVGEGDFENCVSVAQASLDEHIKDWNNGNG